MHGHDCACAVLCQNIRGDVRRFYTLKHGFLWAEHGVGVVVIGDGEGEAKLLHVRIFCVVRLFKRTVLRGAFLEGTSISSSYLLASSRMISAIASRCFLNFASDSRCQ